MKSHMKTLLFSLILLFTSSAFAYDNHLTKRDQEAFLTAIYRAGLDTWHEGDFQYKYIKSGCNFSIKECWVYVEMKYEGRKATAYCHAENIESFDQVYNQKKKRITDEFHESIVECMNTFPE